MATIYDNIISQYQGTTLKPGSKEDEKRRQEIIDLEKKYPNRVDRKAVAEVKGGQQGIINSLTIGLIPNANAKYEYLAPGTYDKTRQDSERIADAITTISAPELLLKGLGLAFKGKKVFKTIKTSGLKNSVKSAIKNRLTTKGIGKDIATSVGMLPINEALGLYEK